MRKPIRNLGLARISSGLVAVLLLLCAVTALAQEPPLVYTQENTGAGLYPAPVFPAFAKLPIVRQLPDPFVFADGIRDTRWSAQEHHRQDYLAALAQYGQGPKPECTGTSADSVLGVPYTCSETASFAFASGSTTSGTLTINVTVVGPNGSNTLTTTVPIVLPTPSTTCVQPATGWPYVIGMTGPTGSWPASAFNASTALPSGVTVPAAGCAATVSFGTFFGFAGALDAFASYTFGNLVAHNKDGFFKLYPTLCAGITTGAAGTGACNAANGFPNGSNSTEYAAWAYGISRVIDGIEMVAAQANTPLPLDTTHSAATGCSYAGKMALISGALDERVALVISQENGGGGAPSWRISHEIETQGSVEDINDTDYDWWDTSLLQFAGYNVYKLPFDNFELMALVAPRALLQTGDSDYYWLGDRSATFDSLATEAIYDNYRIGDRFAYYIDTNHFHCVVPSYQQNATQPMINKFLFGADVSTRGINTSWQEADALSRGAQPTIDPHMWTRWWETRPPAFPWWRTGQPAFPAGDVWNEGGDVMLPLNPTPGSWNGSLTIKTGDTITSQYQLSMPGTHSAATVTVPTSYTEIDVACRDGSSYTFSVPAPVPSNGIIPPNQGSQSATANSQTFTIAANDTSVFPSAVASTTNPGCDDGKPGTVTGSYFFALGLPSPGAGNPGLTGFSTTDGVQEAATTDPLNVSFNISDSNTSRVDWSPTTAINRQNAYSCTPPGCPLTPTITWKEPAPITSGTPLSSDQLDATASALEISGMAGAAPGNTGLLTDESVPGTWVYSPPAGTVLTPGYYTLSATFTPTNIYTTGTSAATAYETFTAATASVPIVVTPPPHHHGDDGQH
jgi:glucuronyl esterase-like protein